MVHIYSIDISSDQLHHS